MTLFRDKYRVESTRLKGWDYSAAGYYFLTICTRDRICFFGDIVADEWMKTALIRPNVTMDEWIVMPNHLHGIIVIHDPPGPVETPRRGVSTSSAPVQTPRRGVSPTWKPNSLGSIVNQIKSVCTKRIWKSGHIDFGWQPRFYDRILRDESSLQKARQYVQENPASWDLDRDKPFHLFM